MHFPFASPWRLSSHLWLGNGSITRAQHTLLTPQTPTVSWPYTRPPCEGMQRGARPACISQEAPHPGRMTDSLTTLMRTKGISASPGT